MAYKHNTAYGIKPAFGIADTATAQITIGTNVTIIPTSISMSKEGELNEYKGANGQVVTLASPYTYRQISVDGFIALSTSMDPSGSTMSATTVDISAIEKGQSCSLTGIEALPTNVVWRLESINVTYSNEDITKVSSTLREYPAIDQASE